MAAYTGRSTPSLVAYTIRGKVASIFGWILCLLFGFVTFVGITQPDNETGGKVPAVLVCFAISLAGVFFIIAGNKIKKRIRRYRQYVCIIGNQRTTPLEQIASSLHLTTSFIMLDLQSMISRNLFPGSYIDASTHSIVFLDQAVGALYSNERAPSGTAIETVVCKNCGASNQVAFNSVARCEYCGSPLKASVPSK